MSRRRPPRGGGCSCSPYQIAVIDLSKLPAASIAHCPQIGIVDDVGNYDDDDCARPRIKYRVVGKQCYEGAEAAPACPGVEGGLLLLDWIW